REVGADVAGDARRDGRRVARPGAVDLGGRYEKGPVLLLQLAVQASELVELDANRLAEAAVGDRPQGASDAEQEDADKLCHQVALPWVELGDDQGQDQGRAAERHRQPPVSEAGAGRESEQASE